MAMYAGTLIASSMDVNKGFLQSASPTAGRSSDGAAPKSQEGRSPSAGGTKKSFASTFRTAQQGETNGRSQQSKDVESRRDSQPNTRTDQGKPARDDSSRSGKIEGGGLAAEAERLSQTQTDQSVDKKDVSQDGGVPGTNVSVELVREVSQMASSQGEPVTSVLLLMDDQGQSPIEDASLQSSPNNETSGGSTAPVLVTEGPEESLTTIAGGTGQSPALSQGEIVPLVQLGQVVPTAQPMQQTTELPSDSPLDFSAEPVSQAVDQEVGEQRKTLAQRYRSEKEVRVDQPSTLGKEQAAAVSQELSRLDAAVPHLDRVVERSVGQKQVHGAAHPHAEPHPPFVSHDSDESIAKPVASESYKPQAFSGSGQPSDMFWSNPDGEQTTSHETPWQSHAPVVSPQADLPDNRSVQSTTVGSAVGPQPRPAESLPSPTLGRALSTAPVHDIEPFLPLMSRSVVFEVAEPDLGRINIRVAMTNEVVHAHLLSDRSDVGQLLVSGQDRLQSALQSNGLEMGQFRVDIDRQNAGRSFQQGQPQDQSRMWHDASNGTTRDYGISEQHDHPSLLYAGMLNVVA